MKRDLGRLAENTNIYTKDNIIHRASEEFLQLTGYKKCDVIGKTIMDLDILLRSEHQIAIQDIRDIDYAYIFTSDELPLEIKITVEILDNKEDRVYYFEQMEDPALKFTLDNFGSPGINKNGSIAIFSYPDCILLKHDENYIHTLSLMDIISDNPISKQPSFSNKITDLFKQDISFHEFGVECLGSDGAATYWDINVKIISGDRNNKYLVSSFYDVTERAQEKIFMKNQRNEMELIVDNMSDVICIIDKDGRYTYTNKLGRQILSTYLPPHILDIKQVNSRLVYDAFEMNDINGEKTPFENTADQRVLRGEKLSNHTIIGSGQLPATYYQCNGTPIYDEKGNIDGGILIYKSIDSGYKIEEYTALQENIEELSLYYAVFSPNDHKVTYINEYAFQIIQEGLPGIYTELDLIGKSFFNFYRADDVEELIKDINKSIENKSTYLHKLEFIRDGKTEHTKTIFQPIFNQYNEVEKIIALGIDISDEEKANKTMGKLLKAQEELFINTSHELKTPLSVIFSGAQLLNLYLEKSSLEDFREDIININKMTIGNCYRLIKLINNILDISKIESGLYELNLSTSNIVAIIDDIVQSVSEYTKSKDIKIIFDPDIEELIIALDVEKFDRILLNLISNAIKYSITGKFILIKLVEKDRNTIRISVTDEGIGIDQKNIDVIFKKFIQLNRDFNRIAEGTGLGLTIAKSMTELHGGSLSVESILGKGSTFTIELPIKKMDTINITKEHNKTIARDELIKYEFSDIY